jgi:hypothetical protein
MHQQNGLVECKHQHIVETCLSLLSHASIHLKYWDEAFLTATYFINRMPSRVIEGDTPYFVFLRNNQTIISSRPLDVLVGHTSIPITHINYSFVLNDVSSCDIALSIKGTSALTSPPGGSIHLVMFFL